MYNDVILLKLNSSIITEYIDNMPDTILNAATGIGYVTNSILMYKPYTKAKIRIACNSAYTVTSAHVYVDEVLKSTTLNENDTTFDVPAGKVLSANVTVNPSQEVALYIEYCK